MIYITGDTHGLVNVDKIEAFVAQNDKLTRDDYLLIVGDFGAVWSEKTLSADLKFYEDLPCTVLFIDGNHENFDLLNSYPVTRWKGGKIHEIKPNIIHLMRGQVFIIDGIKIFAMGGATTMDKYRRREGESWWAQEIPNSAEYEEGNNNLKAHGNEVDYIITHTCPEKPKAHPSISKYCGYAQCSEVSWLSYIDDFVKCKRWYFGHFHIDDNLMGKYSVLFKSVVPLGEEAIIFPDKD